MAKAPDLLFRFDAKKHAAFAFALQEHGITFDFTDGSIPPGALVAIEVEATTDDLSNLKKTVLKNLSSDKAVGLTVIVFAVMPKMLSKAKELIGRQECDLRGVILCDCLQLLDALAPPEKSKRIKVPPRKVNREKEKSQ